MSGAADCSGGGGRSAGETRDARRVQLPVPTRSAGDERPSKAKARVTAAICERDIGVFWLDRGRTCACSLSIPNPVAGEAKSSSERFPRLDPHFRSTVVPCSHLSPLTLLILSPSLVAASNMSSADAKPLPFVYQFAAGKSQCRVPVELRAGSVWIFRRARGMGAGSAIACNRPAAWSSELSKSHLM
jgi:hypothetical protein